MRSDHFHSGIDIKTNGKTGIKVYAIADGYVSRIKVSAYGFGKTLYITHPNGFVSVYAHLGSFKESIAAYVKKEHYKKESFELNIFPEKGLLPVTKGEVVAYSGNTGSSAGPHLHFEIREEDSQIPVNPLLFGIDVKDYIRPKITGLKIYAVQEQSMINGDFKDIVYVPEGWGEEYRLPGYDTVTAWGRIAFGIRTYDLLNDASNKNGVYSVELFMEDEMICSYTLEKFSFDESRYINSFIDYSDFVEKKTRFQRTKIDPNNKLSIYSGIKNHGVISIHDSTVHKFEFVVKDVKGNTSSLTFFIRGKEGSHNKNETGLHPDQENYFSYDHENIFETDDIIFEAPAYAFYDSFAFHYDSTDRVEGGLSKVYVIHDKHTPVHLYCKLSIRSDPIPEELRDKALIASVNGDGKLVSAGGNFENGFVITRIRDFGDFCVTVDTVAPEIRPLDISKNKNLKGRKSVRIVIKDDFSGIKSYEGTLNGNWILLEYDAKNDLLVYYIDERLQKGDNHFKLEVTDQKDNTSIYETLWGVGE